MNPLAVTTVAVAVIVIVVAYFLLRRDRDVSIPLTVDAVRDVAGTKMARMTYYVVTSETPTPGWMLGLRKEVGLPLRVLGQVGIIYRPARTSQRFRSAEEIDKLFNGVEANESLSIETEDIWVPVSWLSGAGEPQSGQVYRIGLPAFQRAFRFRDEQLSAEDFLKDKPGPVIPSPEETTVMRAWGQQQIDRAKAKYPKNRDLELKYRQEQTKTDG